MNGNGSNDDLRRILDEIPLCVYWKNADLQITGANRAFLRTCGVETVAELSGNDALPSRIIDIDLQVIETCRPVLEREIQVAGSDGSVRTMNFSSIPLFDQQGLISGVLGTGSDITESARYRDHLRQRKGFLSGLVEALPVGFFAKDPSSGFSYRIWNRKMEDIFGFPADRAVDSRDWNLFGAAAAEQLEADDLELLESPGSGRKPKIYKLRSLNGIRTVSIVRVPLYDDLLDTTLVAGTVDDITRENELEEQLHQSQKMEAVGRLAGGVAHDFNNLLQVVMGAAEIGSSNGNDSKKYFSQILMAGEKAISLTKQLLSFSREESFNRKPFEVDLRVREFTEMIQRIVEASIKLEFHPGAAGCIVNGDPFQLEQVLMNLIVNARDALEGSSHGSITIETAVRPAVCVAGSEAVQCVVISVEDTGAGIPPELHSRIFEPFFTTKKEGKGTGLGLASCYAIAAKHGGTIQVESVIGEGTRFSVCIPLWSGEEGELEPVDKISHGIAGGRKLTVLLAEDEEMVREIARVILEREGHRVLEAENGRQAVDLHNANIGNVDLAVFDAMMPEMGGREAFDKILSVSPELPCLFCTGYSGDNLLSHFAGRARIGVLQKPYSASDLIAAAEDLTGKK